MERASRPSGRISTEPGGHRDTAATLRGSAAFMDFAKRGADRRVGAGRAACRCTMAFLGTMF